MLNDIRNRLYVVIKNMFFYLAIKLKEMVAFMNIPILFAFISNTVLGSHHSVAWNDAGLPILIGWKQK